MGVAGGMAGGMAPQGGAGAAPKGATTQWTVMAYFTYAQTDIGGTIADCVNAMAPQGVTRAQVRTAVDNLVNEGFLYSTTDNEHYKATA